MFSYCLYAFLREISKYVKQRYYKIYKHLPNKLKCKGFHFSKTRTINYNRYSLWNKGTILQSPD